MSKLSSLIDKLGGIEASKFTVEIDRVKDSASFTDINFDVIGSIGAKALVIGGDYDDAAGNPHTARLTTRMDDDVDTITIDGDTYPVHVDTDVMGEFVGVRAQIEMRYNIAAENVEGATTPDNHKTFNAGNGNHELRIMKSLDFPEAQELGNLAKLLSEDNE